MNVSCQLVSPLALSVPRDYAAVQSNSLCALVAGGAPSGSTLWPTSISGAVDVFDANGVRTAGANITPRAAAGITTNGSHFFVAGGFNRVSDTIRTYSDSVQVVGCDGSVASQALSMQTARAFHASVLYTNATTGAMQSVFAGGITENNFRLTVEVFSHNTQTWRQLSGVSSFEARRQPGAGILGRFLVVAGGSQFCVFSVTTLCSSDQVDVFDLESSSTSTVQNFQLPDAALNFGVTSVSRGALLLMAGGETQDYLPIAQQNEFEAVLDSVVAFNVFSNVVAMNGAFGKLTEARTRIAASTINDRIALFVGGLTFSGASSVVDIYDASGSRWSTLSLGTSGAMFNAFALRLPSLPDEVLFTGVASNATPAVMRTVKCAPVRATTTATTATTTTTSTATTSATGATSALTSSSSTSASRSTTVGQSTSSQLTTGAVVLDSSLTTGSSATGGGGSGSIASGSEPAELPVALIGGVLGGALLLIIIAVVLALVCRRRRRARDAEAISYSQTGTSLDLTPAWAGKGDTTPARSAAGYSTNLIGDQSIAHSSSTSYTSVSPKGSKNFQPLDADYAELPYASPTTTNVSSGDGGEEDRPYAFISREDKIEN
jgi:hypothetical protein